MRTKEKQIRYAFLANLIVIIFCSGCFDIESPKNGEIYEHLEKIDFEVKRSLWSSEMICYTEYTKKDGERILSRIHRGSNTFTYNQLPVGNDDMVTHKITCYDEDDPKNQDSVTIKIKSQCKDKTDGSPCNDGKFCTKVDQCKNETCVVASDVYNLCSAFLYENKDCTGNAETLNIETGHVMIKNAIDYKWQSSNGAVSVHDKISSIYLGLGWEGYFCEHENFNGNCSKQLNHSNQHLGCINLVDKGNWNSILPAENQISSFLIQPNSRKSYFKTYTYKERDKDINNHSTERSGYVELWTGRDYNGVNVKLAFSTQNLEETPLKTVGSYRTMGDLVMRFDYYGAPILVTGKENNIITMVENGKFSPSFVDILEPKGGSFMITVADDFPSQGRSAAFSIAEKFKKYGKTFLMEWRGEHNDRNYYSTTWTGGYLGRDICEGKDWQDTIYEKSCYNNLKAFLNMFHERRDEYAGDFSSLLITGDGGYNRDEKRSLITILSENNSPILRRGSGNTISEEDRILEEWWSDGYVKEVEKADWQYRDYGKFHLNWLFTFACQSLGIEKRDRKDVAYHSWKELFESGVHGIGGFRGKSWWFHGGGARYGSSIAKKFLDHLKTDPVSIAWLTVGEYSPTERSRHVNYLTVETCECIDDDGINPACKSRMYNDYHYMHETESPLEDLSGVVSPNTRFWCDRRFDP